jgi:hypothetical protein
MTLRRKITILSVLSRGWKGKSAEMSPKRGYVSEPRCTRTYISKDSGLMQNFPEARQVQFIYS